MELKVRINKKAILKKYQDSFGAWVTFMFLFPGLLITIMVVAPDFPVIIPVIGGIISVLISRKNWTLYRVYADLTDYPETVPSTEFLNMLSSVGIGYSLKWEEPKEDEDQSTKKDGQKVFLYYIEFYRWEPVIDEEGIATYVKRSLMTSPIKYGEGLSLNGIIPLKGIIPFIPFERVPENYSKEKLLLFYVMD